jgi:hypothetical protein
MALMAVKSIVEQSRFENSLPRFAAGDMACQDASETNSLNLRPDGAQDFVRPSHSSHGLVANPVAYTPEHEER